MIVSCRSHVHFAHWSKHQLSLAMQTTTSNQTFSIVKLKLKIKLAFNFNLKDTHHPINDTLQNWHMNLKLSHVCNQIKVKCFFFFFQSNVITYVCHPILLCLNHWLSLLETFNFATPLQPLDLLEIRQNEEIILLISLVWSQRPHRRGQ